MKYFKPKSLTWWSGLLLAVLVPLFQYLGIAIPEEMKTLLIGSGLIGLRAAAGK
jgi:hypothetical protein